MAERGALQVVAGAFGGEGGTRYGVVLLSREGSVLRSSAGARAHHDPSAVAMEAVLQALWTARSFGRRAQVYVWPPEVAGWLDRRAPVPDRYVAWFVQVRALSHAFREVRFLPATPDQAELARRVASGAGSSDPAARDLELVGR